MASETTRLDEIDLAIVRQLQNDGRRSVVDIAKALGVHRNTVSTKLKRLLDEGIVIPAVYTHPAALGYRPVAVIGIRVSPGEMDAVADHLASFANVHYVFVCLGRYDVMIWGLFRDQDDLYAFVTGELGSTPGVVGTEVMVSLGMSKVSFALLDHSPRPGNGGPQGEETTPGLEAVRQEADLDGLDLAIIGKLQHDARQSVVALSKALGVHRNVVAARLKRLSDQGTVRAVIVPDQRALGYRVMVAMGVSVLPNAIKAASERLRAAPNIHSVTVCTGRYGILLWGFFFDQEELYDFLRKELGKTPGISSAEVMVILRVKKMSFAYLTSS
ncbi:MAG: Lrp/AsnC family transcriptional regulator [Chloroflexi bacterium]|nr:Lrp/AsnC family transcriptional regulator [Chloroflexota bacterium]